RVAGQIEGALRILIQRLRRYHKADIATSGLTVPQLGVLSELVEADGLSLNELSERMRLAHSTVSGIIDRLERREMVVRRADPIDRRFIRIYLSDPIKTYVQEVMPARRLGLLVEVLRCVGPEERAVILEGLSLLCGVLRASKPQEVVSERK
ncbi:MAG: MarR family transcriptional regulator, partial [Chloroflexi bacterium]|nr:MarR family transcriptional regulator [Chloroflexota bacterium]